MARLLNAAGISAQDYSGDTKHPEKVMQEFKEHKIRFLCACDMISEGWDYPELGILVRRVRPCRRCCIFNRLAEVCAGLLSRKMCSSLMW